MMAHLRGAPRGSLPGKGSRGRQAVLKAVAADAAALAQASPALRADFTVALTAVQSDASARGDGPYSAGSGARGRNR